MSKGSRPGQLSLLLWALIILGLVASLSMTGFVSWYQKQLQDKNASLQVIEQAFDLELEKLRRLTVESHSANEHLILSEQPIAPSFSNSSLVLLELETIKLKQDYQISALQLALDRQLQQVRSIRLFWQESKLWKQHFDPIQQDLLAESSLDRARSRIVQLQETMGILEGQFNLASALQMRQWRKSAATESSQLAANLLNRQYSIWPRALKAVSSELNEIALLVELLASGTEIEELDNLKANRLQPAVDRLNRNIGQMGKVIRLHSEVPVPSTRPLMVALFGTGYNDQYPEEALSIYRLGLLELLRRYRQQSRIKAQLERNLEQQFEQSILTLVYLGETAKSFLRQEQKTTEAELSRSLRQAFTWVILLLIAFLMLGGLISKKISSQFTQLAILQDNNELILNAAGEGVIGLNRQAEQTFVNPAAAAMLGGSPEQLLQIQHQLFGQLPTEHNNPIQRLLRGHIENIHNREDRFQRIGGSEFPVQYSARPIHRDGEIQGAVLTFMDITADKQAQIALESSERQFRDLSEKSLVGVYIIQNDRFSYVNPRFAEIYGYLREEIEGRLGPQDITHPADWPEVKANISKRLSGDADAIHYKIRGLTNQGEVIHIELYGSNSMHRGQPAIVGTLLDVTERTRSEAKIQYQAYYDQLTGLPNRTLFNDRLEHSMRMAKREDSRMALLFLDLDRFKHINDSLGHQVGDALLSSVAGRLNNLLRENDTVARLGGDEFTVIVENVQTPHEPATVASNILQRLSEPFQLAGHDLYISASIGICLYPEDGQDSETLVKHADAAMYHAKNQGRSTYAFYTAELTTSAAEWLELETDLRKALLQQQLFLHYQPQIDLASGKLAGVEALIRWNHPQKGLIPPMKFIPLAEDTGLILEIGDWVISEACMQMNRWQQQGTNVSRMAINLSAIQLERGNIVESVKRAMHKSAINPENLELEITENSIMKSPEHCIEVLRKLRSTGISLSIDDFGTGYSSLSLLKELPINRLKIDRSFIADLCVDPDDEAITKAIISMAKLLNLEVVAEGVETVEQLAFIRENGCDLSQGFLHSPPVSAERISNLVNNGMGEIKTAKSPQ